MTEVIQEDLIYKVLATHECFFGLFSICELDAYCEKQNPITIRINGGSCTDMLYLVNHS